MQSKKEASKRKIKDLKMDKIGELCKDVETLITGYLSTPQAQGAEK